MSNIFTKKTTSSAGSFLQRKNLSSLLLVASMGLVSFLPLEQALAKEEVHAIAINADYVDKPVTIELEDNRGLMELCFYTTIVANATENNLFQDNFANVSLKDYQKRVGKINKYFQAQYLSSQDQEIVESRIVNAMLTEGEGITLPYNYLAGNAPLTLKFKVNFPLESIPYNRSERALELRFRANGGQNKVVLIVEPSVKRLEPNRYYSFQVRSAVKFNYSFGIGCFFDATPK